MTIDRASIRTAILGIVLFTVFACLIVSGLVPLLRGANPSPATREATNGFFWLALGFGWLLLFGSAALAWRSNRPRALGWLLAAIIVPFLFAAYGFLLWLASPR